MKRSIIITAGGIGTRMGKTLPKQFMLLNQKPILIRTLEAFHAFDPNAQIIITLPQEWKSYWKELLDKYNIEIIHDLVDGGKERFHSIQNALRLCEGQQIAIHDGVRPLVSKQTIQHCFDGLKHAKAVVPVLGLKDSLRQGSTTHSENVDRSRFFLVHTPQCFDASTILAAYQSGYDSKFTDDASVVEAIGIMPLLVPSNEENIKITTTLDLKILNALLEK
ncbi:MAG: 2-C-methyl-D-erythritol 4-phosphate cytidylyltransferase [Sphingomonadales bacterium]|nr:2-C-methyl-D-erythritol 4-phosphate cytidylyltransferase [Sphingomonadales bacterium]